MGVKVAGHDVERVNLCEEGVDVEVFWERLMTVDIERHFRVVAEFTDSKDDSRIHEVGWYKYHSTEGDDGYLIRNTEQLPKVYHVTSLITQIKNVIRDTTVVGFEHEDSKEGAEDAPPYDQVQLRLIETARIGYKIVTRKLETRVLSLTSMEEAKGI